MSLQSANEEFAVEILQLYYGILILFVVRATLKVMFNYSPRDFHPSIQQIVQDSNFERGWASRLYQPMSYALGASELSFGRYLRLLKAEPALCHFTHLQVHCEAAARLLPVPMEAFILEHVSYFFNIFYPSPEVDIGVELGHRAKLASAQLAELPMV